MAQVLDLPISGNHAKYHRSSLGEPPMTHVENIRCGGNDLRLGFYAAEWDGSDGDSMFVLCGDEDHN